MPQLSAELRHFMMSLAAFWPLCKVVSSAVGTWELRNVELAAEPKSQMNGTDACWCSGDKGWQ